MGIEDPVLSIVGVDGEQGTWLVLEDESRWIVAPGDTGQAAGWLPGMRVTIDRSDDAAHPWALTNIDTAGPDVIHAQDDD
jgi:hypothetical protein